MDFMVGDRDNPSSSIWNCLRAARERARARALTTEMWETTNQTWLEIREMLPQDGAATRPGAPSSVGEVPLPPQPRVTVGTMLHGRGASLRAPRHLPRARRQHRAPARREVPQPAAKAEGLTSSTGLRLTVGRSALGLGFETHRHVYRDVIRPYKVAELLILNADMPRLLHARSDEINGILGEVASIHWPRPHARPASCTRRCTTGAWTTSSMPACIPWLERFLVRTTALATASA